MHWCDKPSMGREKLFDQILFEKSNGSQLDGQLEKARRGSGVEMVE